MKCKHRNGFTLIELMVVITIVGILAAIAIPSYTRYIDQSNRSDAKATLLQLVQILERNYTEANSYQKLSDKTTDFTLPITRSPQTGTKLYDIAISNQSASTYTLTATRTAGARQASDACGDFTINQFGQKGVSNATLSADECWRK